MITITLILITALLFSFGKVTSTRLTKERSDFLKAVFPFAIILHHISFRSTNLLLSDFHYAGPYIVALFFFMSGYGLEYKYLKGGISLSGLKDRIRKLLVPVIFPLTLYAVLTLPTDPQPLQTVIHSIKEFSLVLPYTWFVIILLLFYVTYYILRQHFASNHVFNISLFLFITILMIALYKAGYSGGTFYSSNYAFLIGIMYKQHEEKLLLTFGGGILLLFTVVLFVISLAYIQGRPPFRGFALIGATMYTMVFFPLFTIIRIPTNSKIIGFLKSISYEMYLCQGISFVLIDKLKLENALAYLVACLMFNIVLSFIVKQVNRRCLSI